MGRHCEPRPPIERGFGPDVERADAALRDLFARAAVDRGRVALVGFSDGASYALSLGLANAGLFTGIVALSPGFFVAPPAIEQSQRLFIAHGRADRVLPFGNAARLADGLGSATPNVRFAPFAGGHVIRRSDYGEGLQFVFGQTAR